jgi:hypothetical protein
MDTVEAGDVYHALKYCFSFYRKPFEPVDKQVWGGAMKDHSYTSGQWKEAIKLYMYEGKFAPKPNEVLDILKRQKSDAPKKPAPEPEALPDCPEHIRLAWAYWIPIFHGEALPFVSKSLEAEVSAELAEEYLMTCNKEAWKAKLPDAVPEKFRLKEVWGE